MNPALLLAAAMVSTPAQSPAVVYEGRTVAETDGSVRMGFPGVTALLRFEGPAVDLIATADKAPLYLDVQLDGGAFHVTTLHLGSGIYPLVEDAGPGPHTVIIVRRNEDWQGTQTYHRFQLTRGGRFLSPPALPERKLLFIGDSVTCGELTDYRPGREFSDTANSNARYSYGMVLGARLRAQTVLVSYGGRGLIRDWKGNLQELNAPQFYERTLPDDAAPAWNHSTYIPHAIGVQLGTNDFSHDIPDRALFCGAYVRFVQKLRHDAPEALILLMNSPIVGAGPKAEALGAYLDDVVRRLNDPKVVRAHLQPRKGHPGNAHPTGGEHQGIADELQPLLRQRLGW